jgi:hypothetical protein
MQRPFANPLLRTTQRVLANFRVAGLKRWQDTSRRSEGLGSVTLEE